MIEYIQGEVDRLTPTGVVIDKHGIGYFIHISLSTFQEIRSLSSCKLYIVEIIREDTHALYGFSTQEERATFSLLIGVSSVGANTARMILSSMSVPELQACILGEHVDVLKSVKGIGQKTAQRIIIELKDKISRITENAQLPEINGYKSSPIKEEAIAALQMLGFLPTAASKVVTQIVNERPELPVELVLKAALKML